MCRGMPDADFHVLVIGGGIGGLCLAHGLRRAGVSTAVYERTRTRADWLQGYRIHISPKGAAALHACLPPAQWEAFAATTGKPSAGVAFLTEQLHDLLFLPRGLNVGRQARVGGRHHYHHSVSRITLRDVLLSGLEDTIRLGKTFTHYEQARGGRVTAFFDDGTTATGDVLVGADGANSRVRGQYLPRAHRVDTGAVAIAGKLPLTGGTRVWLPERLSSCVNTIMPARDSSMFTAVWEGDKQRLAVNDPGLPPGLLFDNTQDYVFWAYIAKRGAYPAERDDDGTRLRDMAASMMDGWHPSLLRMVAESDPGTVAAAVIKSMAPVPAWPASRITLLGDAIHNMTPMGGIGANTALRDASLLAGKLAGVRQEALVSAIGQYEAAMREYGFAAVRQSLRNARQATCGPLLRAQFRAMLRAIDTFPPVKRRFAGTLGS
jgi:2-polyprenyl-6-methoxyphenol hydroxylase-like FAD-dependent oxidoreductase